MILLFAQGDAMRIATHDFFESAVVLSVEQLR